MRPIGRTFVADGNVSPCRFIKMDTDGPNRAVQAGDNDSTIGVSQDWLREAPTASGSVYAAILGDSFAAWTEGFEALLELGTGGCNEGDKLKSDTNGKGVVVASTGTTVQQVGAMALEAGVAGQKVRVMVRASEFRPALS